MAWLATGDRFLADEGARCRGNTHGRQCNGGSAPAWPALEYLGHRRRERLLLDRPLFVSPLKKKVGVAGLAVEDPHQAGLGRIGLARQAVGADRVRLEERAERVIVSLRRSGRTCDRGIWRS